MPSRRWRACQPIISPGPAWDRPALRSAVCGRSHACLQDVTEQLTPQELQVARFIAAGASTRQAASQMFLSPRTIDAHLRSIYAKLGITSRSELRAADLGEITHDTAR